MKLRKAEICLTLGLTISSQAIHGQELQPIPQEVHEAQRSLEQEQAKEEAQLQVQDLASRQVLLRKGQLEIEPTLTYAYSSNNNLSIDGFALLPIFVVGQIQSERVRRTVLAPAVSVSYGLLDNLQMEAEVPFRYRLDELTLSNNQQQRADRVGLGDIRIGLATQLHRQGIGKMADVIGNLNLFIPTGDDPFSYNQDNLADKDIPLGSGFWSLGGGFTTIMASDPAILFGSISGMYNFSRGTGGRVLKGRVHPGKSIGYNLGLALALNYQLTINLQVQHSFTFRTKVEGVNLNNSSLNDARFLIGWAWAYNPNRSLQLSIGSGLTEDAPDLLLRVSMPLKL